MYFKELMKALLARKSAGGAVPSHYLLSLLVGEPRQLGDAPVRMIGDSKQQGFEVRSHPGDPFLVKEIAVV